MTLFSTVCEHRPRHRFLGVTSFIVLPEDNMRTLPFWRDTLLSKMYVCHLVSGAYDTVPGARLAQ